MAASSGSWRKFDKNGNLTPESKEFQRRNFGGSRNTGRPSAPARGGVSEKSSDTGGGRSSRSATYDYSAVDEARKSRADAETAKGSAAAAAFAGDIGKAMAAGHAIRALQQKAREAESQGPRIRQSQASHTRPNQKSAIKFK